MTAKTAGMIQEIGGHIKEFAGAKVRDKVMEGGDKAAKSADRVKTPSG